MAICEKRPKPVEPPPVEYVLTLSEDEARVLKEVLIQRIDWTRDGGGVYAERVHNALEGAMRGGWS